MDNWDAQFAAGSPMFAPLRPIIDVLPSAAWPTQHDLNPLAARLATRSGGGKPLQFATLTDAPAPAAADYESRIHEEGIVPLRPANWHDLFNALVWLALPRTKAMLNRLHVDELRAQTNAARSVRRDALTLLDESGVLVVSSDVAVLAGIRAFDWKRVLWQQRNGLQHTTRFVLFGHGLYEKALSPYVGMTGHALLLHVPAGIETQTDRALLEVVDTLATKVVNETLMQPRDLSPLPLLGVPGWWDANCDAAFYDNADYFRSGRTRSGSARRAGLTG